MYCLELVHCVPPYCSVLLTIRNFLIHTICSPDSGRCYYSECFCCHVLFWRVELICFCFLCVLLFTYLKYLGIAALPMDSMDLHYKKLQYDMQKCDFSNFRLQIWTIHVLIGQFNPLHSEKIFTEIQMLGPQKLTDVLKNVVKKVYFCEMAVGNGL